jgi:cupin fold WbuC family metalloprotein
MHNRRKTELEKSAKQTKLGVFHANSWDIKITNELLNDLLNHASINGLNRARLCLNPTRYEPLQFMYIAFLRPYSDKAHYHPNNINIHLPILGEANYHVYSKKGKLLRTHLLSGQNPHPVVTPKGVSNATEIISNHFIKLEITPGMFDESSTVYLNVLNI